MDKFIPNFLNFEVRFSMGTHSRSYRCVGSESEDGKSSAAHDATDSLAMRGWKHVETVEV